MKRDNTVYAEDLKQDNVGGYAPLKLDELQNLQGLSNEDYETVSVLGDILKVEYVDQLPTGEVNRGGIWLNEDVGTKLWRVGRIIKRGPQAPKELQEGTLIRFPSDRGIPCVASGKRYIYINAERIFEVVTPRKNG
jgi:hypothetical protein